MLENSIIHRKKVYTYNDFRKKVDVKRYIDRKNKKFYYIGKFDNITDKVEYTYDFLLDNIDDIDKIDYFARQILINNLLLKINSK